MRAHCLTALTALLLGAACGGGSAVPHEALDESAEPFRSRFAVDSGKVRALFLASPT